MPESFSTASIIAPPPRVIDLATGRAMVVTDFHGVYPVFRAYVDHFLELQARGEADTLILCGDYIHFEGRPEYDKSLRIVLDLMHMQQTMGDSLIMLLGNHELPHIYGITLAKGDVEYTPYFEQVLGEHRADVLAFFRSLPFYVRTAGGTLITHAGTAPGITYADAIDKLSTFSHESLLAAVDFLLREQDREALRDAYAKLAGQPYGVLAQRYLNVSGPEDPRFDDLLHGFIASNIEPYFTWLWDALSTRCEYETPPLVYDQLSAEFLELISDPAGPKQKAMVTGHMPCRGGYTYVNQCQLRVASWTHATPSETGLYLLFDVAEPIDRADDLLPCLYSLFDGNHRAED